jgi:hypothetical protein
MDWTPRLRRNGSKVYKSLRAAARLVRNGDVLMEQSPDYPKVVLKFFTKVLTGLVGTSSEHKKLTTELRKVRKDSRLDALLPVHSVYARAPPPERHHDAPYASPAYGRGMPLARDPPRQYNQRVPASNSHVLTVRALQRHFVNAKLPTGACWSCEYMHRKPSRQAHSAKNCPHLDDAGVALKEKGFLN